MGITREEQDAYGIESYRRSAAAYANNIIQPEIFEVSVPQKKGKAPPLIIAEDEEYKKIDFDKFSKLPTVFQKEGGTVTAGNASTLSDGAAAVALMTAEAAERLGCKPLARIVGYADGAMEPIDFPIAPKIATDKLLQQTGVSAN